MSNAQKKFIVWDWNGTLLDDTDAVLLCVNAVLEQLGHPAMEMELFRDLQIRPLENFYRAAGVSEDKIPLAMEHERTTFHEKYETLADNAPLRNGAIDILHQLKANHISSIIVSNHITDQIERLLKQHNIDHHFDEVIAYISRGKQHRDMTKGNKLQEYIKTNNLTAANAIIVGDTMEEIEIARALGMTGVAITGGIHSEQRLRGIQPHHVIHSLHELLPILQEKGFVP